MLDFDRLGTGEVGDGSRDFQYPMIGTVRETEAIHGLFDQIVSRVARPAKLFDLRDTQRRVGPAATLERTVSGLGYPDADSRARFFAAGAAVTQDFMRYARNFDMHVDAVEQGAGNTASIAVDLFGGAMTTAARIAQVSARAWIHRGNQLESGRETGLVRGAGDRNCAAFQWFSEDFEHFSVEFREFIQK